MGWYQNVDARLCGALRGCQKHFFLIGVLSALINLLYLTPTIYMLQVYDRVVPTGGLQTLLWITIVAALALLTLSVLDGIRLRLLVKAGLRFERLLAPKLFEKSLNRMSGHAASKAGPQLMREFDILRGAICGTPAVVLFDLPWAPLYILTAALINPLLGAVIFLGAAALSAVTYYNNRTTDERVQAAATAGQSAYALHENLFRRREVIKTLGMRRAMITYQLEVRSPSLSLAAEAQMASANFVGAGKFLRLFLQSLALALGAWLAVDKEISPGSIIAVSILMTRALQPIEQLLSVLAGVERAKQAYHIIADALVDTVEAVSRRTALPAPAGHIVLEGVHVRGAGRDDWLLKGVNLEFRPGTIVGIVGPSGAGKTTLARVLSGALVPEIGRVRFDGAELNDWDADFLGKHMGYLPQEIALLPGTVGQNIARFAYLVDEAPEAIDRKVIDAATAAGAHTMIMGLRGAYNGMVGGDNAGLSTGQRQIIALARALYGNPPILVLDEPNSALDGDGEAALLRAMLAARARGAAVIVIGHRIGLLSQADHLVVLKQGCVQETGPSSVIIPKLMERRQVQTTSAAMGGIDE